MTVDYTGNPRGPGRRWRSRSIEQAGQNPAYRVTSDQPFTDALGGLGSPAVPADAEFILVRIPRKSLPLVQETIAMSQNNAAQTNDAANNADVGAVDNTVTNAQLLAELQKANATLAGLRADAAARAGNVTEKSATADLAKTVKEEQAKSSMSTFGKVAIGTLGAGLLAGAGYLGYTWWAQNQGE